MTEFKRRSANAIPLQKGTAPSSSSSKPSRPDANLRQVKIEAKALPEKLQKSVIDNPQAAKKAALLISLWIEGKSRKMKKAG
jgi:hypothetical protein